MEPLFWPQMKHRFNTDKNDGKLWRSFGTSARAISIIVGFALLVGISVGAHGSETGTNSPVRLTAAMFTGYEFTLISKTDYGNYLFLDDKRVDTSFGQINGNVIGIDYGWKIKDAHTLAIIGLTPDGNGPESYTLQFKSFGKRIVVTTDGARYRRTKFKYPN